jgi:hypothetical protein
MSIIADTRPTDTAPARPAEPRLKVTGRRVLRSEWAKLWSLSSTWITLGLGLLFLLAFGTIAALRYKSMLNSGSMDPDFADATAYSLALFGVRFSLIALGVLGVLTASGGRPWRPSRDACRCSGPRPPSTGCSPSLPARSALSSDS